MIHRVDIQVNRNVEGKEAGQVLKSGNQEEKSKHT